MRGAIALIGAGVICFHLSNGALGNCLDKGQSEACSSEDSDSTLLQKAVQRHQQEVVQGADKGEFPDLGKIRHITDTVGKISKQIPLGKLKNWTNKVASKVDRAAAGALTTLATTMNDSLTAVEAKVDTFAVTVAKSKKDIASGVASMLGKTLSINITEVPVGKEYEKAANASFAGTKMLWSAISASGEVAGIVVARGLDAIGREDLSKSFNQTMQAALNEGEAFVASLTASEELIAGGSSKSLATAHYKPQRLINAVAKKLREASDEAVSFAQSFEVPFKDISHELLEQAKETLSADTLSTLHANYTSLVLTANRTAQKILNVTAELLESINAGLPATGIQPDQSAGAANCRFGLGLVAAFLLYPFRLQEGL